MATTKLTPKVRMLSRRARSACRAGPVADPADRDKLKASACSVERVPDGRGVPAAAALGGGDAIGVQSVRDRGQAVAGFSLASDPLDRVRGHGRGAAEPDALRALA